jgi:hypothetical protein
MYKPPSFRMSSMEVFLKHSSKGSDVIRKIETCIKIGEIFKSVKIHTEKKRFLDYGKMYVITHKLFLLYIPTFQMKMVEDGGKVD